jgi:hypothetical protein
MPKGGPPRHIHHREDEWYYVLSSEFLFDLGNIKYTLPVGGSIWAPRGIPHVWANVGATEGRMILSCLPGGFENFFNDSAGGLVGKLTAADLQAVMTKYGIEMLGPPLFPPTS